jgi:hypothetical protein
VSARRVAWLVGIALVLLSACSTPERIDRPPATTIGNGGAAATTPAVSPDATAPRQDATLEGRVLAPDGRPLSGVSISVVRTNTGFKLGRVIEAVVTFGLSCVASPDDCPFRNEEVVDTAVTDADGHYALTLPHAYLPGYETDDDWVASVGRAPTTAEAAGPSSAYELEVNAEVQAAPDLALWDADPTVSTAGDQLVVRLPRLQGAAAAGTTVRFATPTGATVWTVHGTVDPRVLEDGVLRVVASGHDDVTVHHVPGRTIYHQRLNTAAVPYQGTAVPLSRNKSCTLEQTPSLGCPLTDGDLVTPTTHKAGTVATLDLGDRHRLGLLVVRASDRPDGLRLEASDDGASWRSLPIGPLVGDDGVVATKEVSARYLRLTSTDEGSVSEISAWPPREAPKGAASNRSPESEDGPNLLVRVVAALLIGAVGAAVVSRLRRWRRRGA